MDRMMLRKAGGVPVIDDFIITIDTTLGDGLNQIRLPIQGTDPMDIDWGDGTSQTVSQTATASPANWVTHPYASAGVYDVKVSSTLERVFFNNSGDKLKITEIKNWGQCFWSVFTSSFYGCSITTLPNNPIPNFQTGSIDFSSAFRNTKLTSLPKEIFNNVGTVSSFGACFNGTFININSLSRLYIELSLFVGGFGVVFSAPNSQYDPNYTMVIDGIIYNTGTERANLVSRGWNINDGGGI